MDAAGRSAAGLGRGALGAGAGLVAAVLGGVAAAVAAALVAPVSGERVERTAALISEALNVSALLALVLVPVGAVIALRAGRR
jgi:hypothetical protein